MRSFLLLAITVLTTAGCGTIYKQPIYQGNLIRETSVQQQDIMKKKATLFCIYYFDCHFCVYGGLAQLARALQWHCRGHRFDSDILHT